MKKIAYVLVLMGLGFASCNKEQPKPLTKQEMRFKTDSMTQIQVQASDEHARKDLEYRIKVEVKVKVDSIIYAQAHPKAKDTVQNKNINMPPQKKTPFIKLK